MLSPRQSRIVLLPEDHRLIELLGCTEEEYRWFCKQARYHSKIQPGTPTADLGVSIALFVIGVALSVAGSLLAPKPKQSRQQQTGGSSGGIQSSQVQGQDIVDGRKFAPKAGFDTVQNVVEMGSVIPLVYCKREEVNGEWYGGIRINTNLLWSQLLSEGGNQFLRAIFLIGEGDSSSGAMQLDATQFAIGNNLLGSYDLTKNSTSRLSIYYNRGRSDGRIVDGDHIAGTSPADDPGRAASNNVYGVDIGGTVTNSFVSAAKPSTQTQFGLYGIVGCGLGMRTNPRPAPKAVPTIVDYEATPGNPNDVQAVRGFDVYQIAQRAKDNDHVAPGRAGFPHRCWMTVNDTNVTYRISGAVSRAGTPFTATASGVGETSAALDASDMNSAIESRKTSFDENIVIGELYKIGRSLAICTNRPSAPYNTGTDSTYNFKVVKEVGTIGESASADRADVTTRDQIYRCAIGTFITEQTCQVVEVGIRSALGQQINGLVHGENRFCVYNTLDDAAAPLTPNSGGPGQTFGKTQPYNAVTYTIGSINKPAIRTSYFKVSYRVAGSNAAFTDIPYLWGITSETSQSIYNFLSFEFGTTERREFLMEPMSSREVIENDASDTLVTVDFKGTEQTETITIGSESLKLRWNGTKSAARTVVRGLGVNEPELRWRGGVNSLTVQESALVELHPLTEISGTFGSSPEHEIVYVNCIQPTNPAEVPNYEDLAIIGLNIRATREFASLQQLSVYMNSGLGGYHSFPEVLQDLLTNDRFGTGQIVSPVQIDIAAFNAAKTFTDSRNYYFDGTLTEKTNIRSWASEVAGHYLLDFVIRNGRFSLQPIVEFTAPEPITGLFTAGNIIEGSMELTYFDQEQRQPPRVSVKWREERQSDAANNKGLFPVVREITVRESDAVLTAAGYQGNKDLLPLEEIDISDYCTSQDHAIDLAKFTARFRRLSTHQVKFKTTVDQAALDLGKCFRLGMETLVYENPQNGYITEDGTIVSWGPGDTNSNFRALVWDRTSEQLERVSITVSDGKATNYQGYAFCRATAQAETQTYKVQSLAFDEDGNIDVEAIHWPTLGSGYSAIAEDWDNEWKWDIEGETF